MIVDFGLSKPIKYRSIKLFSRSERSSYWITPVLFYKRQNALPTYDTTYPMMHVVPTIVNLLISLFSVQFVRELGFIFFTTGVRKYHLGETVQEFVRI
jgi:hypothetical protein